MISTFFYSFSITCLTIYFLKKKISVFGKVLLIVFCLSSVFSIIGVFTNVIDASNATLLAYLFLILALFIFFSPFLCKESFFGRFEVIYKAKKGYIFLCLIYIFCSLYTIYLFLPGIIQLLKSGNWSMNRFDLYTGELSFPYNNIIELLIINFTDYFRLLILVVSFSLLSIRKNKVIAISSIGSAFISMMCSAIYSSSRGTIVNTSLLILSLFLFFYHSYSKKMKRFFTITILLIVIAMVPYFIVVTNSRFGDNSDSLKSIISYIGQPPVVFNYGVFVIDKNLFGLYEFGRLFGYTGFSEELVGGLWDNGFFTFVGWFFIDWGIIGTLLIGAFVFFAFKKFYRKKQLLISDLFIMTFYFSTLLQGVFVIGRSYCYTIIATLVIYLFLKLFFEKIHWGGDYCNAK